MRIHSTAVLVVCWVTSVASIPAQAQTWMQTGAPTSSWASVACSIDGVKVVAVAGGQFANGQIYISSNSGTDWAATSAPTSHWNSVASSADGSMLAAVAYGGGLYTSTNSGSTWLSNNIASHNWSSIASSADGSTLAAAYADSRIFISTNSGATWSSNSTPVPEIQRIAMSTDGRKIIAGNSFGFIVVSTNSGATWASTAQLSGGVSSIAASTTGAKCVAAASGVPGPRVYTSSNGGIFWVSNSLPARSDWEIGASSADGASLISLGAKGVIYTSTNSGAAWVSNSAPEMLWKSAASSADAGKLFAAPSNGRIWTRQITLAPLLSLSRSNNSLSLSWIVPSGNFLIQQNLSLSTTNWRTITNLPSLNLSNLRLEITLPISTASNSFYRLVMP